MQNTRQKSVKCQTIQNHEDERGCFACIYIGPTEEINAPRAEKLKLCAKSMTQEERLVFNTEWAELRRIHKVHNLYKEYARAVEACQTQDLHDRKIRSYRWNTEVFRCPLQSARLSRQ